MRLTTEGGNAKSGYMRLESEDSFIELKWEQFQPKKAKPLTEIADSFIKEMEKTRKRKISIHKKEETQVFEHDALFLHIKNKLKEFIYFWNCVESSRIVILRLVYPVVDTPTRRVIKRILGSFKCHSEGLNVWSLLGFSFESPPSFLLTERKIAVGRTSFLLLERELFPFSEKRRQILFEYFSMANVRYEDEYRDPDKWMGKWYWKDLKKRYRGIKFETSSTKKHKGHSMLIKQGHGTSGLYRRKKSIYTNATWYCSKLNRIYSVTISAHVSRPFYLKRRVDKEEFEKLSQDIIASIKCH